MPKPIERALVWLLLLYRRIRYGYAYRLIPLTQGKFAKVDPKDFKRLSRYKWHARRDGTNWYAATSKRVNGKRVYLLMHRLIIDAPYPLVVDHINHNGLDNRKANLRAVTQKHNIWNSRTGQNRGKSRYKGVSWDSAHQKWAATIRVNGKLKRLGHFENQITAAKVYDTAAKRYRGKYAFLNFPD